jgi:exocyst complex component 1
LLSQLKIPVLEPEKREAKQKYQEALQSYVIQYFGRPLEKLNVTVSKVINVKMNNNYLTVDFSI